MKRLITLLAVFAVALYIFPQERTIILPQAPSQHNYKDYSMKDNGLWISMEVEGASSIMQNKQNMQFAAPTATIGYRFNEFIRIGVGAGARIYVHNADFRDTGNRFSIPVFLNLRGNVFCKHNRSVAPYWSINLGCVTSEGFYANPTVGYSFGGLRNNFLLGVSYTLSTFTDIGGIHQAYSYFGLKLGYEF